MIFDRKAGQAVTATKILYVSRCIPRYILKPSRFTVLRSYKLLQKEASRFIDPLCRQQLRQKIWEHYLAYSQVSDPAKVQLLLNNANQKLKMLERSVKDGNAKSTNIIMDEIFTSFAVVDGPLKPVLGISARNSLGYKIRHIIPPPDIRTFAEHNSAVNDPNDKNHSHLFFRFLKVLKETPGLRTGAKGVKLALDPFPEGTVFGTPLPENREAKIIKTCYHHTLVNARYPVDNQVIEYLQEQLELTLMPGNKNIRRDKNHVGALLPGVGRDKKSMRFYRRRILDLLPKYYTVTEVEGKPEIQVHRSNVSRNDFSKLDKSLVDVKSSLDSDSLTLEV